jgi:curved DNA-binding protein
MKYKDYYAILGVKKEATPDEIKTAYRKLARKYHPDVSKEKDAEAKFKEMSEAYETLKDPEKRAAYDELGTHRPGEEFRPPPDWGRQFSEPFSGGSGGFEDLDLSSSSQASPGDRRAAVRRAATMRCPAATTRPSCGFRSCRRSTAPKSTSSCRRSNGPRTAACGACPTSVKTRIPPGVANGEKLRVPGKGGKGMNGGPDGDLYLDIEVAEHPVYRASGRDIYIDLPLTPWEAVLGTSVRCPRRPARSRSKCRPGRAPDRSFVFPAAA